MSQTVALIYAAQLAGEGWRPPGLNENLQHLSNMPDSDLINAVAKDLTLPIAPGVWISPKKLNLDQSDLALVRRVDISRPYRKVVKFNDACRN